MAPYEPKRLTSINGVTPSAEVREKLAAEGKPVLVAFSGGKDSICAELALREAGVETQLAYLYQVPGLRFVEDELDRLEDELGKRIHRYPSPSLFRWLGSGIFQSQARLEVVGSAELVQLDYQTCWDVIRDDLGLPYETWLADGVRANDSPQRRMAFGRYGPMKETTRKVSPIWDWAIKLVRETISESGVGLPVDYEMFGRTFDGLDARFLRGIRERFPEDFERIRAWFPMVELELVRREL